MTPVLEAVERAADGLVDAIRACDEAGLKDTPLRATFNRLYTETLSSVVIDIVCVNCNMSKSAVMFREYEAGTEWCDVGCCGVI